MTMLKMHNFVSKKVFEFVLYPHIILKNLLFNVKSSKKYKKQLVIKQIKKLNHTKIVWLQFLYEYSQSGDFYAWICILWSPR